MDKSLFYAEKLKKLICCKTISAADDTPSCAEKYDSEFEALKNLIPALFPQLSKVCESTCSGGCIVMKWPGKTHEGGLLLMNHHDVVPPGPGWTHDPFGGEISDGRIWGRGALDTKGGLFSMLQAGEELAEEGFVPEKDIYFFSSCNEETSGKGAMDFSKDMSEKGISFDMVLDEGGMILDEPVPGAKGRFAMIGVGEKGCADIEFTAKGNGGHASVPAKNTPLVRLGKFMAAAEKAKLFPPHTEPVTAEMFIRLASSMTGPAALLKNPVMIKLFSGVIAKASPEAAAMMKTTLAFTMAEGSDGRNILPAEAKVIGNMRFSHYQGGPAAIEAVRKLAEKYDIKTRVLDPGISSGISDFNGPGFVLAENTISELFPGVITAPYIMTGASDCRYMSPLSKQCLRFLPFTVSEAQLASIHGPEENLDIGCLPPAVQFYRKIIAAF